MTGFTLPPIPYENRVVDIPREFRSEVIRLLTEMGLCLRTWSDGSLTVLIRYGSQGALDRQAITHAEIRFSHNRIERRQWLEMCWQLPTSLHPLLQNN